MAVWYFLSTMGPNTQKMAVMLQENVMTIRVIKQFRNRHFSKYRINNEMIFDRLSIGVGADIGHPNVEIYETRALETPVSSIVGENDLI